MKLPESVNPRRFGLIAGVAAVFLVLIAFRGYQQHKLNSQPVKQEKIPVQMASAAVRPFTDEVSFVANLEPEEQAAVVAKLAGKTVLKVLVDIGTPVKAGQVLAVLDDSLLTPQQAQASAAVAKAGAVLSQARTQEAMVEKDYRRYDELYGEKVISAQQLDHARGQLDVARAGVTLAEKQLAEARSGLNQVNILMGYHALRSPISGVVAARFIDPGDTSSAEKAAFLVNRQERVKVTGAVPEKAFPKLRLGQEGTVLLDALGGKPAKAKIARLAPAIDPVTRTGQAELVLDASKDLKPGMFGRVVIQVGTHEGLAVPREAVQSLAGTGERRVFVNKEGLAQSRTVKTGVEEKDWIEILDGLAVNDQVVLTQSARIGEGSPLEVTNP